MNLRVITANILGVQKFRTYIVSSLSIFFPSIFSFFAFDNSLLFCVSVGLKFLEHLVNTEIEWNVKLGSRTFAPSDICPLPKTACEDICPLIHIKEWIFAPSRNL